MSFINSRIVLILIGIFSGVLIFEDMIVGAAMFVTVGVGTWVAFRKRKKKALGKAKANLFY